MDWGLHQARTTLITEARAGGHSSCRVCLALTWDKGSMVMRSYTSQPRSSYHAPSRSSWWRPTILSPKSQGAVRPASAQHRLYMLLLGLTSNTLLGYATQSGPLDLTEACGPTSQAFHRGLVISNDTAPPSKGGMHMNLLNPSMSSAAQ